MATETAATPSNGKSLTFRERLAMGDGFTPYVLVLPTILVILVIAVYPMIDSIYLSLLDNPILPTPSFVGITNYIKVFGDSAFRASITTTVVFTIVSVALETVFGMGVALLINKTFPGRGLVRAAILVPWAFPTVVSAQMWLLMYNDQTGIITYFLQQLHWVRPGDTLVSTTSGVIIASLITDVWKTTPFMALLILAGLQVIPTEMYEAAGVDGATAWQRFWRITLPMIKNPLLIALLFRTLDAIRVFDLFYVFGGNQVTSIASYADFKMFLGTPADFTTGVAAAVVVFIFGVIISIIFVSMMRDVLRQTS